MDKSAATFILYRILKEETDENHYLTQNQIIDKMKNYGIELERKTVGKYLNTLEELNFDIDKKPKQGVALLSRDFDKSQITFLIDAIFSSKNFTGKQAIELVTILEGNLSKYQRKQFSYVYKSEDVNRNQDSDFFLNVEYLSEAIERKRMIEFQYLSYDIDGNEKLKYNGLVYKNISPYYLVNNFGKYYLLCKSKNYEELSTYRVDYLRNIHITETPIFPFEKIKGISHPFDIKKYMNEHIYIFGGAVSDCKVRIKSENGVAYIKEWFGNKAIFEKKDGITYASFRCDCQAFFYWCLQYGENLEVLEPQSVVTKLAKHYENMVKQYQDRLKNVIVKPNLNDLIYNFLNHYLNPKEQNITTKEEIQRVFLKYLKDNISEKYIFKTDGNLFLFQNGEEKYGILLAFLFDGSKEECFAVLENISYYEKEKNNYASLLPFVLVKPKCFSNKSDSPIEDTVLNKKEINKGSSFSFEGKAITIQNSYSLHFFGIPSLKEETYQYALIEKK